MAEQRITKTLQQSLACCATNFSVNYNLVQHYTGKCNYFVTKIVHIF